MWPQSTRVVQALAEVGEIRGDITGVRDLFESNARSAQKGGDAGFFQSWALFELRTAGVGSGGVAANETSTKLVRTQARVRQLFKRAVTANKYHSASWVAWAKHEQKSGNPETARKLLITGISHFPNSRNIGWFHCSLGHLARQQGDINTARACYERAVKATPEYKLLPVLLEFARMEAFHGSEREALRLSEKAVRMFPHRICVEIAD